MTDKPQRIRLDQFLKFQDLAETGGHAKLIIQSGLVRVNGEVEMRRARKLCDGDCVEYDGQRILVTWDPDE